ncbi:adenosylmethionine--8-amino-7-oxononanoate transaminase [Flavobacterium sp. ASW18X]|uniref:adenosylmethionine--8-amino-7-oxononanoate transaminase n=1 Tax=Flavobacterium sp. ASW18X TaxID=2572595 RepID=UPI0010AE63AF|nr:adenosylmethionine--8-amino-7-oxononanoate transaminase [Flavobacterium sp. ASW18X]TKD65338.1 adenosylmethionine--8-amino-7-oxononanoate transaminase [Flavobacterium sp. ASW18X]
MNLSERDKKYIWHPLTQHKLHPNTLAITRAQGVYLYDEAGKSYIDGISSWYTAVYGHCNPIITNQVAAQMKTLDQIVFSGFTHEPAVKLSEALIAILPDNQQKLFFNDNGSTATEVGIKMALQYHFNQKKPRNKILAFEEGFHGDTFGAMSASGLSVYNGPFEEHFIAVERIRVPTKANVEEVLEHLQSLLQTEDFAGFIYEPLVQGAAAMKMHDAEGLDSMLRLCKKYGTLTIADEVMTGFGKTGTIFASDQLETKPDIICLSKALSAGLVPMAITSCSQEVFDKFYSDDIGKGLFHGHTYSGNPLACTAALAAINLLQTKEIQDGISNVIKWHSNFAQEMALHPKVENVRQLGVIFALDLKVKMERYGNLRDMLFKHFMDQGVFLRPLGNTIYILAPYIIKEEEMQHIYAAIRKALDLF